jgi:hypothetical protein
VVTHSHVLLELCRWESAIIKNERDSPDTVASRRGVFCATVARTVPLSENLARTKKNKQTPWPESASELYRPSDSRLWAKLVPAFVDRGCHVVSVTDP